MLFVQSCLDWIRVEFEMSAADAVKQLIPESADTDLLPPQDCGLSKHAPSSTPQTRATLAPPNTCTSACICMQIHGGHGHEFVSSCKATATAALFLLISANSKSS
ncbi:hypothetical protein WN944_027201 [Citrus x changshan-huyou]|uniref:Uncharacterized protein n=1 Tax=Citrus x changshan-huyou TaxID=2935761 RepID=A0AAP0LKE4_9ROSI